MRRSAWLSAILAKRSIAASVPLNALDVSSARLDGGSSAECSGDGGGSIDGAGGIDGAPMAPSASASWYVPSAAVILMPAGGAVMGRVVGVSNLSSDAGVAVNAWRHPSAAVRPTTSCTARSRERGMPMPPSVSPASGSGAAAVAGRAPVAPLERGTPEERRFWYSL